MATAPRSSKRSTPAATKAAAKLDARKAAAPKKVVPPTADPVADTRFLRMARPDALDYRDRWFRPSVGRAPAPTLFPAEGLPVRHQGSTNACTGFGLSLVVEHLLRSAGREAKPVISHDRWFLDRIATHILAFEGDSNVVWFTGTYQDYEADRKKRLGEEGAKPKRLRFKALK